MKIGFSESQVSMNSKTGCVSEVKRKIKAKSDIEYYNGKTGIDNPNDAHIIFSEVTNKKYDDNQY